jgi:uncharacterized protein (TIGR02284 family)
MIGLTNGVEFGEGSATDDSPDQGWSALVDLRGDDPQVVLAFAESGEGHAAGLYERALDRDDIPDDLRPVIEAQADKVRTAQDELRALREQTQ